MSKPTVYVIAEIAQAHDGSLGILHSYIDAVAETGANAVKFQIHIAEAESSTFEPFRVPFSYVDATRFDYWKRMQFSATQWAGIKEHCERVGLEFLASPFSVAAVHLLEQLGVARYKIASGEIRNYLMMDAIAKTGKPLWISTGMSDFAEIQEALDFLDRAGASKDRVLFQCTTAYPTSPAELGLNVISEMAGRFGLPVGLSDHSANIFAPVAAVALGARFVEFHVVFDKRMFGPDAKASLTIDECRQTVEGVRFIEKAFQHPVVKNDVSRYENLKTIFGKSLALSRTMVQGDVLQVSDLESKKPAGKGIPPEQFEQVVGKALKVNMEAGQFLDWSNLVDLK
jgi:N,N'-diacetyllegionaminate synthase